MIIPEFLNNQELKLVRDVCDASIQETEERMKNDGITKDRINVLGKKYFINNVHKKNPEINAVIFSEKCAEVCKSTIGPTAFLHNEQFVVKMGQIRAPALHGIRTAAIQFITEVQKSIILL